MTPKEIDEETQRAYDLAQAMLDAEYKQPDLRRPDPDVVRHVLIVMAKLRWLTFKVWLFRLVGVMEREA